MTHPIHTYADPMYSTEAEDIEMMDSMMMDVSTLRAATGDFDESNKLGEGGFGAVYKVALNKHVPDDYGVKTEKKRTP